MLRAISPSETFKCAADLTSQRAKKTRQDKKTCNHLKKARRKGGSVFFILLWNALLPMNHASSRKTNPERLINPKHHELLEAENVENSKKSLGEAAKVAGLVGYLDDSVVSRTLIDKKAGTVTLFAFDEGQGLSEHTAPFDALVLILDGEAEITISGKTHRLKEGEMIIMPANEPHALKAVKRFKMMLTMIKA